MPRLLTNDIVKAAITGLEEQQTRIDAQIAQLRQMLSGGSAETAAPPPAPRRKRRKLSAAGRRAIAEAQRKRWAESKQHAEPPAPAAPEAPKAKRRISEEGMKRIIAATKKRWRLAKAAKVQPKIAKTAKKATPATKKVAVKKAVIKKAPAKAPRKMAKKTAPVKKAAATETAPPAPPSATGPVAQSGAWRTHSCVPRRHSCRRPVFRAGVERSLDTARMSACATSIVVFLVTRTELVNK